MASGILGKVDLLAVTNTLLYTVPAATVCAGEVTFCNRGLAPVKVRLALATTATPALTDYIYYDLPIAANNTTGFKFSVIGAGTNVLVQSDLATVTALVAGWEEVA